MKFKLNKSDWWLVLSCGVLGAAINMFRLPLFFEAEFVFGPFMALLVAVFRGPVAGLLTSVITTLPLTWAWGSHWATLTFGLEAMFVGFAYAHKRVHVVLLVMIYWVVIGMPVSWYSISNYELFLDSHRTAILIKQLANGILYAQIAALLIYLPVIKRRFTLPDKKVTFSIKEQSFYIISSLLITTGILFFFINLGKNINNASEKFNLAHQTKHHQLTANVNDVMNTKLSAMNEFKYTLVEVWSSMEDRQRALTHFNDRHPEYKTMIIADTEGLLINSSPPELVQNVTIQNESIDISDRDYFQQTINSQNTYVSPGFTGRGFGTDLITAVSVGVPDIRNPANNLGVVEGSYYLSSMKSLHEIINNVDPATSGILIDQKGRVLVASDDLTLNALELVEFKKGIDTFYDHNLVRLVVDQAEPRREVFYYVESTFDWGWKLVSLQEEKQFATVVEKNLLVFAFSIILMVLVSTVLAWLISRSWTYYMHRLNTLIERGVDFDADLVEFEENVHLPKEIKSLYLEIKHSRQKIIKINKGLQDTIAERTEKLQQANKKLNLMASQDALTKLDNRRVFNESLEKFWLDCQDKLLNLTMMIIDIDHFKQINDTYGHPVGDSILVQVAHILEPYKDYPVRSVSRLGGEEFCILLKGGDREEVHQLAEEIRQKIENTSFNIGVNKTIDVTVSIGFSTINPMDTTATKLYQLADTAMYEAKHAGRNQVKFKQL